MPSYLANARGAVSGTLAGDADSAATAGSLKSVLGAGHINGDFAVKAGWIKNLSEAFDGVRSQDSQALFAGNLLNVGETIPHADRAWMTGSSQSVELPRFVVAALTGSDVEDWSASCARLSMLTSPMLELFHVEQF